MSLLQNVSTTLAKIDGLSQGSTSSVGSKFVNTIFDFENIANGNAENKQSSIMNMLGNVMDLILSLTTSEAVKSKVEVAKHLTNATKLNSEVEANTQQMQQQFGLISQAIAEQNQIISSANAEVANIQGQVTEQQEQINEIIKQIEEKQAKLAQEKDPEKQKELLAEIGTLSAGIVELIQQVPELMEQINNNAAVVTQAASQIETAKGNSVEIQSNGILKITELVAEEAKEVQSNTATAAEAPINTTTSAEAAAVAAEAAATSVVSFGTTAPIAAKATKVSVDQGAAAGIKVAGTTINLKNVFTGIQGLSNGAELISSYTQTIGSALDAFDGCVGNWNSIIEPLVTSIGSYEDVQVSNQELQAAVAKDVETVESVTKTTNVEEENTNAEENNNDISINNSNNFFAQNSVSNEKSKTELETPKVKVIPFGI